MTETESAPSTSTEERYDIAAVCRLTGLSAPALRMWEKRHQAVKPERTDTGRRQYSRRDIQRLTLLKTLTDRGHRIRTIVGLPMVELERRLEESSKSFDAAGGEQKPRPVSGEGRPCRILVVGGHLSEMLKTDGAIPKDSAVVSEYQDLEAAEAGKVSDEADLLLIELPAFFSEDLNRVQRLINRFRALRAIVIYAYAQQRTVEKLEDEGGSITAIRAPLSLAELQAACATDIALANRSAASLLQRAAAPGQVSETIPDRHFSERQLARISQVSSAVECECPHHLSALLNGLNAFESYSAQCENRNAADAEIHAYLHRMTAHARSTVEEALKVLVEFEDIEVGEA